MGRRWRLKLPLKQAAKREFSTSETPEYFSSYYNQMVFLRKKTIKKILLQ